MIESLDELVQVNREIGLEISRNSFVQEVKRTICLNVHGCEQQEITGYVQGDGA